MHPFLFLNNAFLNLRFNKSIIKICEFKFLPTFKIAFKTSLACRLPVTTAVDPNMPSVSQSRTPSDGSPW